MFQLLIQQYEQSTKVYMTINLGMCIGLSLIILGGGLYFLAVYMIKKYEDKLRNQYTFEIVKPKIKVKK